jgi:hypothetical protein
VAPNFNPALQKALLCHLMYHPCQLSICIYITCLSQSALTTQSENVKLTGAAHERDRHGQFLPLRHDLGWLSRLTDCIGSSASCLGVLQGEWVSTTNLGRRCWGRPQDWLGGLHVGPSHTIAIGPWGHCWDVKFHLHS